MLIHRRCVTTLLLAWVLTCPAGATAPLEGLKPIGQLQPRTSREISSSPWAIEPGTLREDILLRAAELGVKWVRLSASWAAIERERGRYDWTETERAFAVALDNGITPLVTLKGGNRLYSPASSPIGREGADELFGRRTAPPTSSPAAMAAWLRFVEATVVHYKGRITHWEIWNEPNNAGYWGAAPNVDDYGRLLRETAAVIKRIDPGAKIAAGATAGLVPNFTKGFLGAGLQRGQIDIVTFHSYGELPEERYSKVLQVRPIVAAFDPTIQLWQGECAFPSHSSTRGWRGFGPWGMNIQAKWLLRQALTDVFFCGVAVSTYGKLFSDGDREEPQPRSALTEIDAKLGYYPGTRGSSTRVRGNGVNEKALLENPSLAAKPGFIAYRNLCAVVDGRYDVSPQVETTFDILSPGVFYGIGFDDAFPSVPLAATMLTAHASALVAYWLPWRPQENLASLARVALHVKGARFNHPVLVDLLDGRVYELPAASVSDDRSTFGNLPLADYPFVIVERAEINLL
jgi:polysaccharide biosynthesis protein PslG